ncbi:hypothetical protein FXO38_24258 [Capsicum annuum]|nr:hypothetical protein FXO38_24258 [Capsicum annuum]
MLGNLILTKDLADPEFKEASKFFNVMKGIMEWKAAKEATAAAAAEKKSPRSLTTIPSEASNVSRDVTSHPARPMSDGQKCSAGLFQGILKFSQVCPLEGKIIFSGY